MSLKFDKDERSATALIRDYSCVFIPESQMSVRQVLKLVSFRAGIADLMLDARIEERMKHTGETKEAAEQAIIEELKATEQ